MGYAPVFSITYQPYFFWGGHYWEGVTHSGAAVCFTVRLAKWQLLKTVFVRFFWGGGGKKEIFLGILPPTPRCCGYVPALSLWAFSGSKHLPNSF